MSQYFIKRGEKIHGPFSTKQVKSGLESGKLKDADLISESKEGPWQTVTEQFQEPAPVVEVISEDLPTGNEAVIVSESEESLFQDLELPSATDNTVMFQQKDLQKTVHQSDVQVPSKSITEPHSPDNKSAAVSYLESAERDIKRQEGIKPQSESVFPEKARYFLHAILSTLCGLMLSIFCPLFCFIPMGLLYKYFQDKEEDLISYMYLGWGVVSALGSVLFLGMAWQGSLKYGEQISNSATGYESNLFQDGWTHPVIWLFSDDETDLQNHKITRDRIRSTQTLLKEYYKTYRFLPDSFDDIRFEVLNKSKPAPKDEWGQTLVLSTTSDKTSSMYKIISSGPDREMDTDDDLVVSGSAQ